MYKLNSRSWGYLSLCGTQHKKFFILQIQILSIIVKTVTQIKEITYLPMPSKGESKCSQDLSSLDNKLNSYYYKTKDSLVLALLESTLNLWV